MATIMVVDDNDGILDAMQAMLEIHGHDVITCSSGEQALEFLSSHTLPQIILLDVLLSGHDGRVICKQIKQQEETSHIPIIMVSAHPSAERSIRDSGANDFVAKPFNMHILLDKVTYHLAEQ